MNVEFYQKAAKMYHEKITLGWTHEQALYYVNEASDETIENWKPTNMVWSHWLVEVKHHVK